MRSSFYAVFFLLSNILILGCQSPSQKEEALVRKNCGSCHLLPSPSLLDKKTWKDQVLPEMRFRMGFTSEKLWDVRAADMETVLATLPKQPIVTEEEWLMIENYFQRNAPDSLVEDSTSIEPDTLKQFIASAVPLRTQDPDMITLLHFDSTEKSIFIGMRTSKLLKATTAFEVTDSLILDSSPSQMIKTKNRTALLTMGIMDPNDQKKGSLYELHFKDKHLTKLVDSLKRPVFIEETDLNNDGNADYVIGCFGNFTGNLIAAESTPNGFVKHIVHAFPGTRKVIIRDVNKDGYNDIISLTTQGDEKITLFLNRGEFTFHQRQLLRFPPVYGSSYFDLIDVNKDGYEDIIYANGDNADYSTVRKPYHGVRIYLNNGDYNFNEDRFFPMHGASQVVAKDFDGDGDLDIAAIAFFPDFNQTPERGFLYFMNTGGDYKSFFTPLAAEGRWITMETGDIDSDGDEDIMLGALNFSPAVPALLMSKWRTGKTSILLLRNQLIH